jgi:hypothetical protein
MLKRSGQFLDCTSIEGEDGSTGWDMDMLPVVYVSGPSGLLVVERFLNNKFYG